uniref:EF-hand domain-containing protein n=1 Tax=Strigamia maritima TaxID=126957 RepID=T1IM00_STRMM
MRNLYIFTIVLVNILQVLSTDSELIDLLIDKYHSNNNNTLNLDDFQDLLDVVYRGNNRNKHQQWKCNGKESVCNVTNQCLSSKELLEWIDYPSTDVNVKIDKTTMNKLCPLILTQIEMGFCASGRNQSTTPTSTTKSSHLEVWGYGILFVTVISLCSLVGVSVLPFMGKSLYQRLLTFLIGLAVGSLSGSAVFHLLPQAFDLISDDDHEHGYLFISLGVMGGIYLFFMTECLMKILMEARKRSISKLNSNYSDVETLRYVPATISEEFQRSVGNMCLNTNLSLHKQISETPSPVQNYVEKKDANSNKVSVRLCSTAFVCDAQEHRHEHHIEFKPGKDSAIATVAWMIIFGDGLHNFIDGLSIGAAFNKSILTGVSISLAVLCEEFPHELGDFAVLLNAGMSMKQALLYNFLSACTCYLGLIVGVLLGELTAASTYIFALAGGMFLYISLVDMIPEMNETLKTASQQSVSKALVILLLQNLGWLTGVTTLFILAYYNNKILIFE